MSYVQNCSTAAAHATGQPEITFLYKLVPGLADRSFGLNVARMASLPDSAIQKAEVKAAEMEAAVTAKHGWVVLACLMVPVSWFHRSTCTIYAGSGVTAQQEMILPAFCGMCIGARVWALRS